ncbi:glycosyltransferase [Acidithiobacillus sp.]|jgi:rhamnosyltransferase|uniref:glycosyltransferase family 2 protein n=1 Tax=Acidithiobacillus sp. TaxID=1872118 RepID=UPI0025BF50D3|nr:glycosyltransferase [Acidithiobacillus sp.]MCK9187980.1 glycosyltransferase [Acidithiobacillus sp.]MCK9359940.1 glycosyltransferase [Acidithiobacillus sp.]
MTKNQNVAVIVPIFNGGTVWRHCASILQASHCRPTVILAIDSASSDNSDKFALDAGFDLIRIDKNDFDHGGTRQMAAERLRDCDILIYMTQDAILASPAALESLVEVFNDPSIGVAYGRQLPRKGASPIEAHARLFNYPAQSNKRTLADKKSMGIKVAFSSDSFAAYRTSALFAVGGFPEKLIFGEDMVVAAKMLQAGWSVAYVAEAEVFHSHGYTLLQEFKRYFDIGVFHDNQGWMLRELGKPEGEGYRFVTSEIRYLLANAPQYLPSAALRTVLKYFGYKLGLGYRRLPKRVIDRCTMHKRFWLTNP